MLCVGLGVSFHQHTELAIWPRVQCIPESAKVLHPWCSAPHSVRSGRMFECDLFSRPIAPFPI